MPSEPPPDRLCLFLDVDGSLIDIAPRPEAVVVPPTLVADLQRAEAALHGALALVSGRSIAQLDRLFDPLRLRASGVHGAEFRLEPDEPIVRPDVGVVPGAVRDDLAEVLRGFPGTFVEDKTYSLAVHYRAVPAVAASLQQALEALLDRQAGAGLALLPGHFVVELKRPTFDKGGAVRRFLEQARFAGRTPVFVGDDVTDGPGFAAAIAAGGRAYGVGRQIPGTTGTFASPSAVRTWIGTIATKETIPA